MIAWAYAFIDRPMAQFDTASAFWSSVTATTMSPRRGDHGEFATFIPDGGDPYVKLQGVDDAGGAHLDLSTDDVDELRRVAESLGATTVAAHADWHVLRSPAGQLFCAVPLRGERARPAAVTVPGGATSRLDQVCIDVGAAYVEAEVAFWARLTGWPSRPSDLAEFHVIQPSTAIPIRLLVQRLETDRPTNAHIDIACSDVAAVRAWHESHGAEFAADGVDWTVMRDPAGGAYCLTNRGPA